MPATWTSQTVSLPIPLQMLRPYTQNYLTNVNTVTLNVFNSIFWKNPRLTGTYSATLNNVSNSTLGEYKTAKIPISITSTKLENANLVFDSPLQNGVYLSQYWDENAKDGWYQLVVMPSQMMQTQTTKKISFLFDWDINKTSITQEQMLSVLQNKMSENLTPADSFNVAYFSGLNYKQLSPNWIPATTTNIQFAFSTLSQAKLSTYSNLPILLSKGYEFVQSNRGGRVLLVSASDGLANITAANQLIADLAIPKTSISPIHIADLTNQNYASNFTSGQNFYGNDYLYQNLTRQTGGEYRTIRSVSPNTLLETMDRAFSALGDIAGIFDVYSRLEGGFCYGRIGSISGQVPLNKPFFQFGRLSAKLPFIADVSGVVQGKPFSQSVRINDVRSSDFATAQIWGAQQMRQIMSATLSNNNYYYNSLSNDQVTQVQDLSFQYRLLSPYTAFLALEPSMGGTVCSTCQFGSTIGGKITALEVEGVAADKLEAYPNPMQEQTTLNITFAKSVNPQEVKIEVYNLLGQVVKRLRVSDIGFTQSLTIQWDGKNESGEKVANGVYLVSVTTKDGKRMTLKIVVKR